MKHDGWSTIPVVRPIWESKWSTYQGLRGLQGSSSRDFGQDIAQLSGRIAKENVMQGCRNRIFKY